MNNSRLATAAALVMACGLVSRAGAISRSPALLTDNGGRIVGTVENVGLTAVDALVKANGHFGHLLFYRNGKIQGEFSQVFFSNANCTGTAYVNFGSADLPIRDFLVVTRTHPTHRLFYALAGATSNNLVPTSSSQLYDSDTCTTSSQTLGFAITVTEDTTAAAELNALAPPFHVTPDDTGQGVYTPVAPCRAVDTRTGNGGLMSPNVNRKFTLAGICDIPGYQGGAPFVKAVLLNVTVLSPSADGYLTIWPGDQTIPASSTLNFSAGQTVANSATVGMAQDTTPGNDVAVRVGFASAHVVLDVVGYYTQ